MTIYPDKYDYCFTVEKKLADDFEHYLNVRNISYVRKDLYSISFFEAFVTSTGYKNAEEWIKKH